jgi:hypothetical protein
MIFSTPRLTGCTLTFWSDQPSVRLACCSGSRSMTSWLSEECCEHQLMRHTHVLAPPGYSKSAVPQPTILQDPAPGCSGNPENRPRSKKPVSGSCTCSHQACSCSHQVEVRTLWLLQRPSVMAQLDLHLQRRLGMSQLLCWHSRSKHQHQHQYYILSSLLLLSCLRGWARGVMLLCLRGN